MTKADLVREISEKTGLAKKDIGEAVDQFVLSIKKALADGHHIEIRGFGTFKVKARKSRTARNPRTGDPVPLPSRRVPVFKVSKELKERVALGPQPGDRRPEFPGRSMSAAE
jgi:nucleoid DNA-binding protein